MGYMRTRIPIDFVFGVLLGTKKITTRKPYFTKLIGVSIVYQGGKDKSIEGTRQIGPVT